MDIEGIGHHISQQYNAELEDVRSKVMAMGDLIEFDATNKIFTNPEKKKTEDYITGRYG